MNEQPGLKITPTSNLRQGDSLSSYLFLLCTEGFSSMIDNTDRTDAIKGVSIVKG